MDTSNNAAFGQISVTCYHTATADVLCAGGGDFDRVEYVQAVLPCDRTTLDNGATLIQDNGGNCFYRKNFGLNGVADARQCGVYGDGTHDDIAALNNCLNVAANLVTPSLPSGIPVVSTGGGIVRVNSNDIQLPSGEMLSCGGTSFEADDNNYTSVQHAIWLYNKSDGSVQRTITGDTDASSVGIDGCVILRSNSQAGGPNFDYAPNAFAPTTMRGSLLEVSHFVGTAIVANTSSFTATNSTILGFAQCWMGSGPRLLVRNVKCDGTAGFWVDQSGGGVSLDDTQIRPFLNGQGGCEYCKGYTWTGGANFVFLQKDSANGQYQVWLDASPTGSPAGLPQAGDTVWVNMPRSYAQSAAGRYDNIPAPQGSSACPSANCVHFDLPGSVWSRGDLDSNKISTHASFFNQSKVLTALTFDIRKLAIGMNVGSPSSGCVQAGTKIVDINPAWNTVWISAQTSCDSMTNNSVYFWDDAFASTSDATVTLSATERTGDAYKVTNTGGVTFNNCRQLNHYVGFHAGDNANLTRFSNCANDNDSTLQDDGLIGLLCDGMHQGNDCSDTDWVNGVLGQHAAASIVVESDSKHALHVTNAGLGPTNGRQTGRLADVRAGGLLLSNVTSGNPGNIFVSNGETLVTLMHDPNFEGHAYGNHYHPGDVLTQTGGTCSQNAQITIDTIENVGTIFGIPLTWHQSRPGICTAWPSDGWSLSSDDGSGAKGESAFAIAQAAISNVIAPSANLYLQDQTASDNTVGCGNILATVLACKSMPPP